MDVANEDQASLVGLGGHELQRHGGDEAGLDEGRRMLNFGGSSIV